MSSHSGCRQFDRTPFVLIKGFAFDQDRPGGPCKFVGQRSNQDAVRWPSQQCIDPSRSLTSGNDGPSVVHQQRSDTSIPTFGDSQFSDLVLSTCLHGPAQMVRKLLYQSRQFHRGRNPVHLQEEYTLAVGW